MFATFCRVRINDGLAPARPFGVRDGGVPAIIEGPALLGPGPAQLREALRVSNEELIESSSTVVTG